jgi:hypothetical protein
MVRLMAVAIRIAEILIWGVLFTVALDTAPAKIIAVLMPTAKPAVAARLARL